MTRGGVPEIPLAIDAALRDVVRLGIVSAAPISVAESGAGLLSSIERTCGDLAARYSGRTPGEIPEVAAARRLYRDFGIDPTRVRPSSEALLRRVLRGQPFPRICNAVDVGNLCSLWSLLPLGLYDADAVEGPVILRRGLAGESYEGIRKDTVHLEGRPALVDQMGPFGNPTSDSPRTAITSTTRALWMVIFAPAEVPPARLQDAVAFARACIEENLAGPAGKVETVTRLLP